MAHGSPARQDSVVSLRKSLRVGKSDGTNLQLPACCCRLIRWHQLKPLPSFQRHQRVCCLWHLPLHSPMPNQTSPPQLLKHSQHLPSYLPSLGLRYPLLTRHRMECMYFRSLTPLLSLRRNLVRSVRTRTRSAAPTKGPRRQQSSRLMFSSLPGSSTCSVCMKVFTAYCDIIVL